MKIYSRIRKLLNSSSALPVSTGWWPQISSNGVISPEQAMLAPTFYACVDFIARTIAATPTIVYWIEKDGDIFEAKDHPLYNLLRWRPNSWQTAYDFKLLQVTDLCLSGFYAAIKVYDSSGNISGLILLDPASVTMTQNLDGRINFSGNLRMGGPRIRRMEGIPQSEVHFCMYRTLDGCTPVSPLRYAAEATRYEKTALSHGVTLLDNDSVPPLVIAFPGKMNDQALQNFKKQWQETGTGAGYGTPKILDQDPKVTRLDMSNEDAQYLESRKFNAISICSIFGVPPRMVGIQEQAKGWQTIEQEGQDFLRFNLRPWIERMVQAQVRDLIPAKDMKRVRIDFDTDHIDMPDMNTYTNFVRTTIDRGVLSPNEVRLKLKKNKRKGGDVYMYPQNMAKETAV